LLEYLERRDVPAPFTPGNLIVLQGGDPTFQNGTPNPGPQAPLYLNEYTTTAGGAQVQQVSIPATGTVGGTGNQPITIDLSAAAGNGQLNRTYDGTGLVFGAVDSTANNGGYVSPQTPTGSANRVIAVVGNDPGAANFLNTTTYGPFYVGDDNRGGVAESRTGPVWAVGHPNQAGGAVSQGVLFFPTVQAPGTAGITAQTGTQISAGANIRGGTIGFDNRLYWTTAGSTQTGLAGVYTETQALPDGTQGSPPAADVPVVKALFSASKLGGVFLADVNGDGILDNGDRIYFNDDGTVGGGSSGGIYMSVYDTTRYGGANAVAGQAPGWSPAVRIAEGVLQGGATFAQLRGLAGTVLPNGNVQLFASEFDNTAGNNSYILGFLDNSPGVLTVTQAQESGNTVTITAKELVAGTIPAGYVNGASISVNNVSTGGGTVATGGGYNGSFTISGAPVDNGNGTFSFTYTDTQASNLGTITNPPLGVTGLFTQATTSSGNVVQTLANGTITITGRTFANQALRGVSFAPTQQTTVSNLQVNGGSSATVPPGTNVTFTVSVSNPQSGVILTGLTVTFIDQTTNTVIGQGTINGSGVASFTTTTPLVGNHTVSAYFAGGGTQALASAKSANTVTLNEAGSTASATTLASSLPAAAIGRQVTLTATVTGTPGTPSGTVSFYNGSVSPANLIGNSPVTTVGGNQQATLTTSFNTAGTQTIIAVYNGDNNFAASQNSTTVNVAANATATITTSANNVSVGATPTYTVTINGNATLGDPSVGGATVQFFLDGVALGGALPLTPGAGNTATASVVSTPLTAGSHLVTVSFTAPTAGTNPYNSFAVNTTTAANGVALIETARQALTPGNLLAVQRGDGTTNLGSSGYLVFLAEYRPDGTLVQRIALPNADAGTTHALLLSGQNGAEGLINKSANGQFLTIVGYDVPVGRQFVTSTFPFQFGRTIARIDANGNVDTSTVINTPNTTSVPYNPSDVVSNDGTQFWLSSNLPTGDTTDSGILFTTLGNTGAPVQIGPANVGAASIGIFGTGSNAQLVVADGIQTVGTGLPTTPGQTLGNFPNLQAQYNAVFPTNQNPEQLVFLNTNDGSSNNPNLLYVADQANGLLKFWKDNSGNWHLGRLDNTFGQKLVFSGGATGVVATVINPGTPLAKVNIYVTGSNLQGANPNQIAFFQDQNGAPAGTPGTGVDQGFSPGNFSTLAFVGGTPGQAAPSSPNGNMNFAGLALVPGFVPGNLVVTQVGTGSGTLGNTATATSLDQFTPAGLAAGTVTLPTATVSVSPSAVSWSGGTVTVTANNSFAVGQSVVLAGQSPSGFAGTFAIVSANATSFTYALTTNPVTTTVTGATATVGSTGVNITAATWSGGTVTITANNSFAAGNSVAVAGISPAGFNGTFTIVTANATSFTYALAASPYVATTKGTASVATNSLTENGTATTEGYLTTSADGHTLSIAGYNQVVGGSTGGTENRAVGVVNAAGVVDTTTQLPQQTGSTRVAVSADGLGFWVATSNGVRYVPFGNVVATAPVTAASWSAGTVTVTANNNFVAGQTVSVSGITPSGYNGTFTVLSATATSFTYALNTNPGATTSVAGATATILTRQITNEVPSPTAVGIFNGALWASAGAGAQSSGVPALDSPFVVSGSNPLATVGGQAIVNPSPSFPTATNAFGHFPSTNQFWVSPDGNTILIADSRTDSTGGLLEYFQSTPNNWVLLGHLQLNTFSITNASEVGTTVTITYSGGTGIAANDFPAGKTVEIDGVGTGYNGTFTITASTTNNTFTYTSTSSGLATVTNAGFATSTDGGLRALVIDGNHAGTAADPMIVYATTTGASGNRLVKITGVTTDGTAPTLTATVLSTAPTNTAYRGVAFSPTNPGTTASTTTLAVTNSPATYGTGVTLTATVTTNATGWVSFRDSATGLEIGAAPVVTSGGVSTATFVTQGNLFASGSAYNIVAVYTGDNTFAPSTSAAQSATINKATPSTTLTVSANPVATGVSDTLTATISVPVGTNPTGTVTFFDGATQIGTAQQVNQVITGDTVTFTASLTTTFSTLGSHSITATYNGDSNFNANTSSAVALQVVNATTTVVTTDTANPAASGATVHLTATVSSAGAGTITGNVQFFDNLLPIGSPVAVSGPNTGATAQVTVTTALLQAAGKLTPGLHSITAVYTPDAAAQNTYFTSSGVLEQAVQAQAFGANDEFVYRTGDGTTSLIAVAPNPNAGNAPIGSTIYIDEYTPAGALVQSIILPSADGTGSQNTIHAVVGNGQQSPTGQLTLSGDGQYLFAVGYDAAPLAAATAPALGSNTVPRSIARIKFDGTIQTEAFTAGSTGVETGGNINGVFSPDGNQFYVSGFNGVYYFSSFAPSASLVAATAQTTSTSFTVTGLEVQSGNLVAVGGPTSGASNLIQQYTGLPTAVATLNALNGVNSTTDPNQTFTIDAYFTHLNGTGAPAGINTMYLSDDGPGFANGHITKWALSSGGTWNLVGTLTAGTGNTAVSFYWLSGRTDGSGNVTLYVTYGQGGNGPATSSVFGALYSVSDTNGYNAPIGTGGTASNAVTTLASVTGATSLQEWRGAAFAPQAQAVATTTTLADNGLSAATAGGSIEQGYGIGFTVTVSGTGTPTGTVQLVDAANGNALVGAAQTLVNGSVTFTVTATAANNLGAGTHQLVAVYTPTGSFQPSQSAQVGQVVDSVFKVQTVGTTSTQNFTQTATGYQATFNAVVNPANLNLYLNGGVSADLQDPPVAISSATESGNTVTITTSSAHGLSQGQRVVITGVSVAGYNGEYTVVTTPTSTTFTVTNPTSGLASGAGGTAGVAVDGSLVFDPSNTRVTFVATGTFQGSPAKPLAAALAPGASYVATVAGVGLFAITNTQGAVLGSSTSTGGSDASLAFTSSNSATAPVVSVPFFARGYGQPVNVPNTRGASVAVSTATEAGTTVTVTTGSAHGFTVGQPVAIAGVSVPGYNGIFTVTQVLSPTQFTYTNTTTGLAGGTGGSATGDGTNGMPISISVPAGASALTSAAFDVSYDPTLLTVTGGSITAPGFTGTVTVVTPGLVHVALSGGSLAAGSLTNVASLTATVPASAPYKSKEVLDVRNISINGGTNNGIDGSAVHVAAFFGDAAGLDATAGNTYNAQDAFVINQVGIGAIGANGITNYGYKLLDPRIVTDIDLSNGVNSQDSFFVNQQGIGINQAQIPLLATPPGHPTGGPDPRIFFVGASGSVGQTVTVAVDMQVIEAAGFFYNSDDLALTFDPTKFSVSNVRSGSMGGFFGATGQFLTTGANVDNIGGTIRIGQFWNAANPPTIPNGTTGDLVLMDITILSGTPTGPSVLNVAQNVGSTNTDVNGGTATLTPAPTNATSVAISTATEAGTTVTVTTSSPHNYTAGQTVAVTGVSVGGYNGTFTVTAVLSPTQFTYTAATSGLASGTGGTTVNFDANVDSIFTVVPQSGKLSFPDAAASSGSTFTEPVILTVGPGGYSYNSDDLAITFDPTKLQVVSVVSGSFNGVFGSTGQQVTTGANIDNTGGTIRVGQFWNAANPPFLPAGATGHVAEITFTVLGSASPGTTFFNLAANVGSTNTDLNGGTVQLSPAPTNATNDPGIDGVLTISVHPNQPPFNQLPAAAAIPKVLFNPATAPGLRAPTPNTAVFSSANGDAITVTDSDFAASGPAETTTLTLTGTGSTGAVGTLTLGSTANVTVTGNGTATVMVTGSPANITAALAGLTYQPGAGFFGTANLTVSTTDNGNTGFGGPMTDTRSMSIPVVGLYISELMLGDNMSPSTISPIQYVEVFSTVPNYTIPSNVYLVSINGNDDSTILNFAGDVSDVFKLGGFTTGSNGYLALLEKGNAYSSAGVVSASGTVLTNTGTDNGFGNGSGSVYGSSTGVHTGTGNTGGQPTDTQQASVSYLLIQSPTTPSPGDHIDSAVVANPTSGVPNGIPGGAEYNSWNVVDGVAILDGSNGDFGPDTTYAPVVFKASGNTAGTTLTGATVIPTSTWTATFAGRIAKNTGYSSADWLASQPAGSAGSYTLSANSTAFAGQSLNSVGAPNFWAPAMTVQVNDGNPQRSQVSFLVLNFNEAVTIGTTNLASVFQVKDAANNAVGLNITSNGTVSGSTLTGVTQVRITFTGTTDTFNFITAVTSSTPQAPSLPPGITSLTTGLNDGNYFLSTDGTQISNNGVRLDFQHNGNPGTGGTQTDEFYRLFGDSRGSRSVDGLSSLDFRLANNSGTAKGQNTSAYRWYFDFDENANIDIGNTTDKNAFLANLYHTLNP
jgi:hypothetical protein